MARHRLRECWRELLYASLGPSETLCPTPGTKGADILQEVDTGHPPLTLIVPSTTGIPLPLRHTYIQNQRLLLDSQSIE